MSDSQRMNKSMMSSPYYTAYAEQTSAGKMPKSRKAPMQHGNVAQNAAMQYPNAQNMGSNQGYMMPDFGYQQQSARRAMPQGGTPIYAKNALNAPVARPKKQVQKEYDARAKQKRREKDYFFVMRKGVCFWMMLFSLLIIAVLVLSIVGLEVTKPYTSLYAAPDNTTVEDRAAADANGDGTIGDYTDTTTYVSFAESIYGFLGKLGLQIGGEEYTDYNTMVEKLTAATESEAAAEDGMASIALIVYTYFPIAIAVLAILALTIVIMCLCSFGGKRIYKGFGAISIVMFIMSAIAAIAGLAALGALSGNPQVDADGNMLSLLDFNQLLPFLSRLITGAPSAAVDGTAVTAPVVYAAGYGLLAILVLPILTLIFSMFARRKIPYSVFDR